jgi:hypothetical protein
VNLGESPALCGAGFFIIHLRKHLTIMDCITDIIGVTNNASIPFYNELSEEMQAAIAVSNSDLFMDALPGGIDLMAIDTQESMEFALQSALDAKTEAQKSLKADLLLAINSRFQPAKIKFNGQVGQRSVSGVLHTSGQYQGQRYRMIEAIAGNIKINAISLCLNGAATFNVYIHKVYAKDMSFVDEPLHTLEITTVAGSWTNATMPEGGITLPMEEDGHPLEYWIFYDRNEAGGLMPKNNNIRCGSCNGRDLTRALNAYMTYKGVAFSDTQRLHNVTADERGHGFSVSMEVGCDTDTVVCREYDKQEAIQQMMAWATRYKAGELWIEYIFKGAQVNRVNLQNREYLWGKRNHFRKEYEDRITAIANNLTLGETNCYTCKEDKIVKGTIYS